jgi:hypothetical protein
VVSAVYVEIDQLEAILWLEVSAGRSVVSRGFCVRRNIVINDEED